MMNILQDILYPTVDEIRKSLDEPESLSKQPDAVLFGSGSGLDSVGLVNFIVSAENRIEERYGRSIVIASEKAFSRSASPFRTLGNLEAYIHELLEE